jgi:hypothetical protein
VLFIGDKPMSMKEEYQKELQEPLDEWGRGPVLGLTVLEFQKA